METRIKTLATTCAGLALALGSAAWALDAGASKFLDEAIRANLAEVKIGKLAQQRGESKDVRDFAKTLVSDHSIAFEKSSTLAEKLGMTAPIEMTAEDAKTYEAMSKLSGAQFDRQFAAHMVKDHEKDIDVYTNETLKGKDKQVVAYAEEALPTLKQHLAAAQAIERDLKVAELSGRQPERHAPL